MARAKADQPMRDRSRRPRTSPARTAPSVEKAVVDLPREHGRWRGRKLRQVLIDRGHTAVPAPSTITHILRRQRLMHEREAATSEPWKRFKHAAPNDLWQMDFKGTFTLVSGRYDPLTVLDDHSRYNLVLEAVTDMSRATMQQASAIWLGRSRVRVSFSRPSHP